MHCIILFLDYPSNATWNRNLNAHRDWDSPQIYLNFVKSLVFKLEIKNLSRNFGVFSGKTKDILMWVLGWVVIADNMCSLHRLLHCSMLPPCRIWLGICSIAFRHRGSLLMGGREGRWGISNAPFSISNSRRPWARYLIPSCPATAVGWQYGAAPIVRVRQGVAGRGWACVMGSPWIKIHRNVESSLFRS